MDASGAAAKVFRAVLQGRLRSVRSVPFVARLRWVGSPLPTRISGVVKPSRGRSVKTHGECKTPPLSEHRQGISRDGHPVLIASRISTGGEPQVSLASDSLVSTKLRPSQARPRLVGRPRLTQRLDRETGRKLTLISAPAGFGKTTLLVEWLRERAGGEGSVAWLSLDEGDNDPVRFLSYLVIALRSVEEEIREAVLSALRSPEPPRIEAITAALINELAALPEELPFILDDYHVIDSEPVHEVVSFLLEHLPPNLHIVIASRIDPPLQLVRLRARNQMTELGAAELSFTSEEAATFLNSVMGLDLSAEDVAALEERTEGWIAGL